MNGEIQNDVEIFEDALATFWFDKDGILHIVTKPVKRTLENSKAIVKRFKTLLGGKKVYVISDLTPINEITEQARAYYKNEFPSMFKAIAFVSASELGRMVGTVLYMVMDPTVPTKIFHTDAEASIWLHELEESGESILPVKTGKKRISGKIVLVDDEPSEKLLMDIAMQDGNWNVPIEYFSNASAALTYLKETRDELFLIISDIKMPGMDGFTFKKAIDTDEFLRRKSIPFIYASNSTAREDIAAAYDIGVQGYFQKPLNMEEAATMFDKIFNYWLVSRHPHKDNF